MATADDIRRFQLDLARALSVFNGSYIVTGVKFLFRVTLRRRDRLAELPSHPSRNYFQM